MSRNSLQTYDQATWLLGDAACPRVEALADSLFSRALAAAQAYGPGKYEEYQPWMTGDFKAQVQWPSTGLAYGPCPVILEEQGLKQIKAVLDLGLRLGMGTEAASVDLCMDAASIVPGGDEYHKAWSLILSTDSYLAELLETVVRQVVPIKSTRLGLLSGVSSSSQRAVGVVFSGLPRAESPFPVIDLAISLAHELGHQVLMIYQRSDRILLTSLEAPSFSGTRGVNRPAIRAVHAATALAFMAECCRLLGRLKSLSPKERAYLAKEEDQKRRALKATVRGLSVHRFTPFGEKIFAELRLHAGT